MKKKLRLQVEELDVEQFQVDPSISAETGTVHAHSGGCYGLSNAYTEPCRFCYEMPITFSCNETECA